MSLPALVALAGRCVREPRACFVVWTAGTLRGFARGFGSGTFRAIQPAELADVILATDQVSAQSVTVAWPSVGALRFPLSARAACSLLTALAAALFWFGVTRDLGSVMDPSPRTIGG
jgi:hypothetical protein